MVDCDNLGVTPWGSQPRHRALYVFGVDVITEEVEDIDVDFITLGSIYSILIVENWFFLSRDELFFGALEPDAGVAYLKRERQVRIHFVGRVWEILFNRHNNKAVRMCLKSFLIIFNNIYHHIHPACMIFVCMSDLPKN